MDDNDRVSMETNKYSGVEPIHWSDENMPCVKSVRKYDQVNGNAKKQRKQNASTKDGRRIASKRKWFDENYVSGDDSEDLDVEWAQHESAGNSSDSDPAWSPPSKQSVVKPSSTGQKWRSGRKIGTKPELKMESTPAKVDREEQKPLCITSLNGQELKLSFSGYTDDIKDSWYESGKFIMLKSDFKTQKNPCLWRIDGKNLLQKYEPVVYKEELAFRNISTYSSWSMANRGLYIPIESEFILQSKSETVVKFNVNSVMLPVRSEIAKKIAEDSIIIIDNFQVYLQTLISQALDSNFLAEIAKENDEYFLTSIAAIEGHWVQNRLESLLGKFVLPKEIHQLLDMYPELSFSCVTSGDHCCKVCGSRNPTRKLQFLGQSYDRETLEKREFNSNLQSYLLCLSCTDTVLLLHQLLHFRWNLFGGCSTKVENCMKVHNETDGPKLLNMCLADQQWTSLMYGKASLSLAETDQYIRFSYS